MQQLPADIARVLDQAAETAGVERALLRAIAWVESRGNPRVVSRAGAMGLLQLMPRTAHGLGLLTDAELQRVLEVFESEGPDGVRALSGLRTFDAAANALAGAKFFRRMLDQSGGEIDQALARYNWGPGNVNRRGGSWPASVTDRYIKPVRARYALERDAAAALATAPAPAPAARSPRSGAPLAPVESCSQPSVCPCCGQPLPGAGGERA